MKKTSFLFLLMVYVATIFAQQTTPAPVMTRADHLAKAKNKNTLAWVLLGGGFLITTTGIIVGTKQVENSLINLFSYEEHSDNQSGVVIIAVGAATMLSSIPFFIAATKNKRLAAETPVTLNIKMDMQPVIREGSMLKRSYPAISLRIRL